MCIFEYISGQAAQEFSQLQHEHMTAPEGIRNYLIGTISGIIVLLVLIFCIKYFLRPGEKEERHIKKRILDDDIHNETEQPREREP
jgi:cbb3-type cytochrome oxidase subunit 3